MGHPHRIRCPGPHRPGSGGPLTCATCGSPAGAGQKFCGDCGAPLAGACPSCGTPNTSGQKFCGECGAGLGGRDTPAATAARESSSAGPVAERRLVSIMFADLVGFTPFAEERDAEDVRETLTRYFDLASEVIARYGGTVEKFIGDAVMAVWGTPTAREDDAERAVRAALELVDAVGALGPGIRARAGVLTGEAAVTLGATNQGMVAGDLVNTASRLQSVAPVGTVLVGDATYRSASRAIVFEIAGEQELKGKVAPVAAWRAVRVVAERGGRGRSEGLEAPFVGRDGDLRLLKDLFHATERERRVRLVSILGIGGIGKSRLAWEFEKYIDGIVDDIWWHHGRSPAYGEGVTFWALGEMIRSRARLAETDDEATTRAAVSAMVDQHLPGDADRRWVEQALLELLGVRADIRSDELFGAWRTFFERLAATGPVVLVFQDLHWADPGTLDFIDHLLEWSRGAPIYIVTLARPELLDARADWGAGQRSFTSIHLEPLAEIAIRQLLAGLAPSLPDATVDAIVSRAEGIPLYAVETLRMLVASGQLVPDGDGQLKPTGELTELAVPETLTALIAARLDALDGGDRALLLDASVLGQSFSPAGLAAISGAEAAEVEQRLRALVRREVLTHVGDPRSPERGQYAFVQALIREVAYNTLARADRKTRHLAAARWFESLGEDELAGALAGHYLSARANATEGAEADALAAQARVALRGAADRAAALGSHQQARSFYEQALSVTTGDAEIAELSRRAGDSAAAVSDYDAAERHLVEATARYRAAGDRSEAARTTGQLGQVLLNGRRVERGMTLLEDAATEYADLEDDPGILLVLSQLARGFFLAGDNGRAYEMTERVLPPAERADLLEIIADTLVTKGSAIAVVGRRREGLGVLETGGRIAEAIGMATIVLRARNNSLSITTEIDPRSAFEGAMSGISVSRKLGQRQWMLGFVGNLGFVAMRTGDWDVGVDELEGALADAADPLDRLLLLNNLVNLRAVRGEPYAAEMDELERTAATSSDIQIQSFVRESRGWVALARGRIEDAREEWRQTAALDPSSGGSSYGWAARLGLWLRDADGATTDLESFYHHTPHGGAVDHTHEELRAGIEALRGDPEAAAARYRVALQGFRDLRLPVDEAITAIDILHTLGPEVALARETAEIATATFRSLGAGPLLELLESAAGRPVEA
jgi:class 3 adenylate cyclase/tetratricopeptide (TPR) repeat protein